MPPKPTTQRQPNFIDTPRLVDVAKDGVHTQFTPHHPRKRYLVATCRILRSKIPQHAHMTHVKIACTPATQGWLPETTRSSARPANLDLLLLTQDSDLPA